MEEFADEAKATLEGTTGEWMEGYYKGRLGAYTYAAKMVRDIIEEEEKGAKRAAL